MKYNLKKQIKGLKQKGIKFQYCSEDKAREILSSITYYYKITCYRKNFSKNASDKYENVDFALLHDLSIVDMRLRYILFQLSLDIEHALKADLINSITLSSEDGYSIVDEFDQYQKNLYLANKGNLAGYQSVTKKIIGKLENQADYNFPLKNTYSHNATSPKPIPIWVLLESMSYGFLEKFITFYVDCKKPNYKYFKVANDILIMTKRIRDASAHSRPILMNIGNVNHVGVIGTRISNLVETKFQNLNIYLKETNEYSKCIELLKNLKVHDLFCLLSLHSQYIKNPVVKSIRKNELIKIMERAKRNKELYQEHNNLKSIYNLFEKIINEL